MTRDKHLIRVATPPPDWLRQAWAAAKRRGLDTMTLDEINAEIDAFRAEKRAQPPRGRVTL
jgi:hypothetical protein